MNELLRKVEVETETFSAESLAKEIFDEPDEPQPKRPMLSKLQDPRNYLPRFPIKTWEESVGTEQPECPMPSRQCMSMAPREKKALWTTTKKLYQKTIAKHNAGVSGMYLFIWLGCTRETRSSHSYSASTAVHPALAAIAARAGFRGTALVLVQEPVLPANSATCLCTLPYLYRCVLLLFHQVSFTRI